MKKILLSVAAVIAISHPVQASADTRAEIIEYVIDPCFMQGIRDNKLDVTLGKDEALKLLKMMQRENVETMIRAVQPLVVGKELSVRRAVYTMGLSQCLQGMSGKR